MARGSNANIVRAIFALLWLLALAVVKMGRAILRHVDKSGKIKKEKQKSEKFTTNKPERKPPNTIIKPPLLESPKYKTETHLDVNQYLSDFQFQSEMLGKKIVVMPLPKYWLHEVPDAEKLFRQLIEEGFMRPSTLEEKLGHNYKKPDLMSFLNAFGLSNVGVKVELIARLIAHDKDAMESYVSDIEAYCTTESGKEFATSKINEINKIESRQRQDLQHGCYLEHLRDYRSEGGVVAINVVRGVREPCPVCNKLLGWYKLAEAPARITPRNCLSPTGICGLHAECVFDDEI